MGAWTTSRTRSPRAGKPTSRAPSSPPRELVALLTAPAPPGAPALRLRRATVTGALRLLGARVGVPVELRECTFAHAPDLRMAELAGLALTGSRLPGLRAGNLRVAADLLLDDGFDAAGPVDLTDAQIGGSLRLSAGRLRGAGRRVADRVVVEGTCYARRLRADDELRLPGARITGNLDLAGADADLPDRRRAGPHRRHRRRQPARRTARRPGPTFTARGRVRLAGARIGGDLVFSGAEIASTTIPDPAEDAPEGSRAPVLPAGIVDPAACLVADRMHVDGNLELDDGLRTTGTRPAAQRGDRRLPAAVRCAARRPSGGSRCSPTGWRWAATSKAATPAAAPSPAPGRCGWSTRTCAARASLSGCTLATPDGYALLGDRLHVGGELYLRRVRCEGTVRMQNLDVGATAGLHRRHADPAPAASRRHAAPVARPARRHDRQGPGVRRGVHRGGRRAGAGGRRAQVRPVRRRHARHLGPHPLRAQPLRPHDHRPPRPPGRPARGGGAAGGGAGRHVHRRGGTLGGRGRGHGRRVRLPDDRRHPDH